MKLKKYVNNITIITQTKEKTKAWKTISAVSANK